MKYLDLRAVYYYRNGLVTDRDTVEIVFYGYFETTETVQDCPILSASVDCSIKHYENYFKKQKARYDDVTIYDYL